MSLLINNFRRKTTIIIAQAFLIVKARDQAKFKLRFCIEMLKFKFFGSKN